jgi:hypothetical protein
MSDRASGGTPAKQSRDGGPLDGAPALPADYHSNFTKPNEPAMRALTTRTRDVAVGAIIVEEHFEKSSGGGSGPVMVMEKRAKGFSSEHGDWRYTVVGSSGQLVKDGVVESCAGCHDDAPMDGFFPIVD